MRTGHSPRNVLHFPSLPRPFAPFPLYPASRVQRTSIQLNPWLTPNFDRPDFIRFYIKKERKRNRKKETRLERIFPCPPRAVDDANPVLSRQARQHRSIRLWDPTDAERRRGKDVGSSRNLELEHLETVGWRMHLLAETIPFLFHISGTVLKKSSVVMRKNIGRSNASFEFPRNRRKFVKLSCR